MRRFLPHLVLAIVIFNLTGYYFLFASLQQQAKYHAQQLIRNSSSAIPGTLIKISKNSAESGKKGFISTDAREFRRNGVMFDVLSIRETADSIYFYCYEDKDETALIGSFLEYLHQSADPVKSNQESKFSLKNLVQFFYQEPDNFNLNLSAQAFKYPEALNLSPQRFRQIFSPPPDIRSMMLQNFAVI